MEILDAYLTTYGILAVVGFVWLGIVFVASRINNRRR